MYLFISKWLSLCFLTEFFFPFPYFFVAIPLWSTMLKPFTGSRGGFLRHDVMHVILGQLWRWPEGTKPTSVHLGSRYTDQTLRKTVATSCWCHAYEVLNNIHSACFEYRRVGKAKIEICSYKTVTSNKTATLQHLRDHLKNFWETEAEMLLLT